MNDIRGGRLTSYIGRSSHTAAPFSLERSVHNLTIVKAEAVSKKTVPSKGFTPIISVQLRSNSRAR
jgi:hypothetical protein